MSRVQIIPEEQAPDLQCQAQLTITVVGESDTVGRILDDIEARPEVTITDEPRGWLRVFYGWERIIPCWSGK